MITRHNIRGLQVLSNPESLAILDLLKKGEGKTLESISKELVIEGDICLEILDQLESNQLVKNRHEKFQINIEGLETLMESWQYSLLDV